jgi:hypothetical protein
MIRECPPVTQHPNINPQLSFRKQFRNERYGENRLLRELRWVGSASARERVTNFSGFDFLSEVCNEMAEETIKFANHGGGVSLHPRQKDFRSIQISDLNVGGFLDRNPRSHTSPNPECDVAQGIAVAETDRLSRFAPLNERIGNELC